MVIVGGGIVGITAALGLAKKTALHIAIIDAQPFSEQWSETCFDHRVSAISLASQRIFKQLNVWDRVRAKRLTPYSRMVVWDELNAKIEFDHKELHETALGFIVEDSVMRASLTEELNAQTIQRLPGLKLSELNYFSNSLQLVTENGDTITTKLLLGADGANSWVRSNANIAIAEKNYNHTALVTTVQTALPHQNTAWQRFTKTGPVAFLPLTETNTSSIVWSTLPEEAENLLSQQDEVFKQSLYDAFDGKLGEIVAIGKRYHYPLKMRHAKQYVLPRIALLGDAAHTIHPLAGQGVNLGLLDAACLVEVIAHATHKKRDFASVDTLRKYERWRKGDNLLMLKMVEILKDLFMNDQPMVQSFRQMGLGITDRVSLLKRLFAHHALGNYSDLPVLARNDVLL